MLLLLSVCLVKTFQYGHNLWHQIFYDAITVCAHHNFKFVVNIACQTLHAFWYSPATRGVNVIMRSIYSLHVQVFNGQSSPFRHSCGNNSGINTQNNSVKYCSKSHLLIQSWPWEFGGRMQQKFGVSMVEVSKVPKMSTGGVWGWVSPSQPSMESGRTSWAPPAGSGQSPGRKQIWFILQLSESH